MDVGKSQEPFGALSLVWRSLSLLGAHFAFLFPLAAIPSVILAAVSYGLAPELTEGTELSAGLGVSILVEILVSFLITGVMCLASIDALLGKRHTIGEYLGQTLRHLGPIIVLGVLVSIATGLGFVLLVVPGLYILARYLPWTAAVVFENAGWSGLGRAQGLTEGYRWPLMIACLGLGVIILGAILALSPLLAVGVTSGLLAILLEGVLSGVYNALIAIFVALAYLRLRELKEGLSIAQIAESFE